MNTTRIIALGDVVGEPGRRIVTEKLSELKQKYNYDFLIVNAENSAGGHGITPAIADEFFKLGVDVITLGDHTFDQNDISLYLDIKDRNILRPANFPPVCTGRGHIIVQKGDKKIAVINLIGRVFIDLLSDCPFRTADQIIKNNLSDCVVRIVDMHAEATSEKYAMARYLDSQVSLIFGTHTHVPTADETILPGGTGYITDIGMCGSYAHVIGMHSDAAVSRFLGLKKAYKTGKGQERVSGVFAEIDSFSGKALKIERISC